MSEKKQKTKHNTESIPNLESIKKENEDLKKQYGELKETLQRLQAEFENYRKRTEEDKSKFISIANRELIQKIIPIIDNLELAISSSQKSDHNNSDFFNGIELIYSQIKDVLLNEGVTVINCNGKFDPKLHEALIAEESDKEPGTILEELQKGYKIKDTIIRHAKVKIANGGK